VTAGISPRRAKPGGVPRTHEAPGRGPSADPRRWRTAGGPVAGAQLGTEPLYHTSKCDQQVTGYVVLRPCALTGWWHT
jgi:hypothetical protein